MQNNFHKTIFTLLIASIVLVFFKIALPKNNSIKNKKVDNNIVIDSIMIQAIKKNKDSLLLVKRDSITIDSLKKINNAALASYKTNLRLEKFYKSLFVLEKDKNAKVQIAYYGDSMNDGDLIVQDLRKLFQEKYGGKGVGFVNIYSESARSRGSVFHNYSDNWLHSSFLKRINSQSLGISGYVAFADTLKTETWVSYIASNLPSKSRLYNPTLYYGKSDSAKIYIDRKGVRTEIKLKGKNFLNTYKISSSALYKLKLYFKTNDTPIYGINFATKNGIHIDNFSTRGNSGLGLTLLRYNLMQQFQRKLSYDLIILQFGNNVMSKKHSNYSWYKKGMKRAINHLQKTFKKADVLVFSVADKSRKYGTEMKTDSAVYELLKAQYFTAKESNSSFLSLYELMGGKNTMIKWVEEKPIKANKDYTHFNITGSKEISKLIFDELEEGYKKYKQKQYKKTVLKDSI